MALITRVTRLFTADMHAVLDRLEEPDVLLRQAIREMRDALAADRQQLRAMHAELAQTQARSEDARRALAVIAEELDTCFEAGREDLARAAVRRRLETTRLAELLARRGAGIEQSVTALERRCEDNAARLADLESRAELLREEPETDDRGAAGSAEILVRENEVDLAFLREQRERGRS